jgi:hypothetical protein
MRAKTCLIRSIFLSLLALLFFGHPEVSNAQQVPAILNYQGRIAVSGTNFTGAGLFRFELVNTDASTVYWSNDGSISGTPQSAVPLTVSNGLYSVLLGGSNMAAIPTSTFSNPDVRLRIWFDDGVHGSELLAPDQRIAAVGYAVVAGSVPAASIGNAQLAAGSVDITKLAPRTTGTSVGVGGIAQSVSSVGFVTSSVSPVSVITANLVTTGRPVWVCLNPVGTAGTANITCTSIAAGAFYGYFAFYRDGQPIATQNLSGISNGQNTGVGVPASAFSFIDLPPTSGPHTYELRVYAGVASTAIYVSNVVLEAFEF